MLSDREEPSSASAANAALSGPVAGPSDGNRDAAPSSAGFDALFAAIDASCGTLPTGVSKGQPGPPPRASGSRERTGSAAGQAGVPGVPPDLNPRWTPLDPALVPRSPGVPFAMRGDSTAIAKPPPRGTFFPVVFRGNESGSDGRTLATRTGRGATAARPARRGPGRPRRRPKTEEVPSDLEDAGWSSSSWSEPAAAASGPEQEAEDERHRSNPRPLESVPLPALDRESAKKLPRALRQIADFNPRGVLEGGLPDLGRRKRKAVKMEDYVSEAAAVRQRGALDGAPGVVAAVPRTAKRATGPNRNGQSPRDASPLYAPAAANRSVSPPGRAQPDNADAMAVDAVAPPPKLAESMARLMETNGPMDSPPEVPPTQRPVASPKKPAATRRAPASVVPDPPVGVEMEPAQERVPLELPLKSSRDDSSARPAESRDVKTESPAEPAATKAGVPDVAEEAAVAEGAAAAPTEPEEVVFDLSRDAHNRNELPTELRRLLDFNGKGATEAVVTGRRKRKPPKSLDLDDSPSPALAAKSQAAEPKRGPGGRAGSPAVRGGGGSGKKASAQGQRPQSASPAKRARSAQPDPAPASAAALLGLESDVDLKNLPLEMRRLLDFNRKGLVEAGIKKPGAEAEPLEAAPATAAPPVPAPSSTSSRLPPFTANVSADREPLSHKVWLMLAPDDHRRFVKTMRGQYKYKQHVPTPAFFRAHGYNFSVHVQREGEFIATAGWSHAVLSGNSRGYSWSHVDPSTIERLEVSDAEHGSRQADGKPNSFSAHFARSDLLLKQLKNSLKSSGLWEHSEEELRRYVDATKTDTKARKRRLAEGWRPAEIRPVYLPTMAQLEDPKWFTAMMSGPGKELGSLHVRFPKQWRQSPERNFGHVSWAPSTRVWKLEVSKQPSHFPPQEGVADSMVNVKVIRPESKGLDRSQAVQQLSIRVPTSPSAVTNFIHALPEIAKHTPFYYGPQTIVTPQQKEELARMMPSWALPESEIDGMRNAFSKPAEGTTTPSGFGGQFGVTGLHDEYNHTVSIFVYPWATAL